MPLRRSSGPFQRDPFLQTGRRLALQLWVLSIVCWWGLGMPFSRLWWLVNERQLHWIFFCYAWEVPIIGWTGAVFLPYLVWRRLSGRFLAGDPDAFRALTVYPAQVALLVLATSSLGYLLGAVQINIFAHLPTIEFFKIAAQGPVLGAAFGVAAFLLAERAVREVALSAATLRGAEARSGKLFASLYSKVLVLTVTLVLAVLAPIFLFNLTLEQERQEAMLAQRLSGLLAAATDPEQVTSILGKAIGPETYWFVADSMTGKIVDGRGERRRLADLALDDPQQIMASDSGWFASRQGRHQVVVYRRISGHDRGDRIVVVAPFSDYRGTLLPATLIMIGIGGVTGVIGLGLAMLLARNLVDPLHRLRAATSRMAGGNLNIETVAVAGADEVSALARDFDHMAQEVRANEARLRQAYEQLRIAQEHLVQAERLSAVGRVVSGVAHELNNPLSAILHFAEDLQADEDRGPSDREALTVISDQARRSRAIVRDLLAFVRARDDRREQVEVEDLIRSALQTVRADALEAGVTLHLHVSPGLPPVEVDRPGIEQVLTNLLVNGIQACPHGGHITVSAGDEQGRCSVSVEDDGVGIDPDVLPRLFEPFFTTKPQGKGTGLGLSVSLGIVEQHGGTLTGANRSGAPGARFTMTLPWAARRVSPDRPAVPSGVGQAASARMASTSPGRVLIIDDEPSIRMALRRFFQRFKWVVDEADSGADGLNRLAGMDGANGYDVVITDLKMPGMSGIELHDRIRAAHPDQFRRLIIVTGDVASAEAQRLLQRTDRPVLEKPFEIEDLMRAVGEVTS
ncbi:MAG: ATP-binding protein [Gemmatimonadales bacterium]